MDLSSRKHGFRSVAPMKLLTNVTFSVGLATIKAAKAAKKELCKRAAKLWGIDEDAVIWKDGYAHPAGANAGNQDPIQGHLQMLLVNR